MTRAELVTALAGGVVGGAATLALVWHLAWKRAER